VVKAVRGKTYSEKDIKSLHGLDAVRAKPQMYIGPTDSHGLFTILREVADNTVDEFLAGRNKVCQLFYDGESFWCLDGGEGIPVGDISFKAHGRMVKMSALTACVSQLHTGGKLTNSGAYETSVGTHGIGAKATNALSEDFQVWTFRAKKWYTCAFKKGELVKQGADKTSGVINKRPPPIMKGFTPSSGTLIKYTPDMTLFDKGSKFHPDDIFQWAELTTYINPGFKVVYTDLKNNKIKEWYSKDGISEYLKKNIAKLKCTALGKHFILNSKVVDVAIAFSDADGINLKGYTNGLLNADGGVHIDSLYAAISKAITPYKKKKHKFTPSDLREGLVGIVNAKIASPKFNSQTKEKLVDDRIKEPATTILVKELTTFFKNNKAMAMRICDRASELKGLKDEFTLSKNAARTLTTARKSKLLLPGKLLSASGCKPSDRELYIVEGDSAAGCFVGNTPVLLADGSTKTFEQLVQDSKEGKLNYGLAYNKRGKKFVKFKIDNPHATMYVNNLIELTLSDGSIVMCTLDHPFMLENGSYKKASDLTSEDKLRTIDKGTI